jgi:hypothetical protein
MELKNKSSFYALPKRTSVPLGEPLRSLRFFNLKDMETWKDIPGFEGIYQVSDLGRVKSLERKLTAGPGVRILPESILKPMVDRYGYLCVNLYKNRKYKTKKIHRLVMLSFVGESHLEVNHKNKITSDNSLVNLEYMTTKENTTYSLGIKILDTFTNTIYNSRAEAARDLYKQFGYNNMTGLRSAIRRNAIKRFVTIT